MHVWVSPYWLGVHFVGLIVYRKGGTERQVSNLLGAKDDGTVVEATHDAECRHSLHGEQSDVSNSVEESLAHESSSNYVVAVR